MKKLNDIFEFFGSDKHSHDYGQYYEKYFQDKRFLKFNLVEIGILEHPNGPFGASSLRAWDEYFPNALIHGFDLLDHKRYETERIKIYVGDQSKREDLRHNLISNIDEKPQIIIDDGSHRDAQQQISLGFLFQHLAPGGLYVIEDLTQFSISKSSRKLTLAQLPIYGDKDVSPMIFSSAFFSNNENFQIDPYAKFTTSTMLLNYCLTKKIESQFMYPWEVEYLNQQISFINIHPSKIFNLNICFIGKKY
tara:strand:+ start:541 stop:1287 length:747 start_codon:yes stop_codon:yes gene_type:complete